MDSISKFSTKFIFDLIFSAMLLFLAKILGLLFARSRIPRVLKLYYDSGLAMKDRTMVAGGEQLKPIRETYTNRATLY